MLTLEDKDRITQVIHRYATGIDTRDWPLLRTCFCDEVDIFYEPHYRYTTGDAITQVMVDGHVPFGKTLHRMTNIVIEPTEQGAKSRTYVNAVLMYPDNSTAVINDGYYDDRFVIDGGEWRIKARHFVPVRSEGDPAHVEMVFPRQVAATVG